MVNKMEDLLKLFNQDFVRIHQASKGKFSIIEKKDDGGKGLCYFQSNNDVLIIKAKDKNTPLWALKNQQCAEGSFLVLNSNTPTSLHIIEMKSGLNHKKLEEAMSQLKGMYLVSFCVLSILKLPMPKDILVYIAYKKESITNPNRIPQKSIGVKNDLQDFWESEKIELFDGNFAKLIKGQRIKDNNGNFNCDFGMV